MDPLREKNIKSNKVAREDDAKPDRRSSRIVLAHGANAYPGRDVRSADNFHYCTAFFQEYLLLLEQTE
jgi:hypothetical protein